MDILELGALDQAAALERGDFGCEELMRATLQRVAAVNGRINAIVALRAEADLLAEARAADAAPRRGWMHGLPVAVKDLCNAAGLPTSMGSPLFAGQVARQDDLPVARMRAAGAIVIGKTNTPEFGLGSHTYNPVFGVTRNPYDPALSAGGSSGGAAAALAARMLAVADGSDMMGSLRNPAGWCNVYGMRPSWGLVPSEPRGELFLHPLASQGPMARNPRDLGALLQVMAGPDPRLPFGMALEVEGGAAPAGRGARIGWLGDWGGAFPMEPGILDLCRAALARMAGQGMHVADVPPPFDADAIWQSWIDLRAWAVSGNLAPILRDPARRDALKPEAIWETERGLALSGEDIQRAGAIRSDWFRAAALLFRDHDALALPTAQVWPFAAGLDWPRAIAGTAMDSYHRWMQVVVPASLIGLPVISLPAGFGPGGLPMGMQLIGRRGSDAALLRLAEAWHAATDWPGSRPPPAPGA